MRHRWFALGAMVGVAGILAADMSLLHIPAIRNGWVTYAALAIPVLLALAAVRIVRSLLTIAAVGVVILLCLGYGGSRTLLARLPPGGPSVHSGDSAPSFTLKGTSGQDVSLESLRGDRQLVLVFFRGHW